MMKKQTNRRPGLILLVVLGMLALFSLLAVTYVLFSGHSRAASVALARSEIRSSRSNPRPLFEEAIMQLIRGTTNADSSLYGHDLLGDLLGDRESLLMPTVQIRDFVFVNDNPNGPPMNYTAGNLQRPMLIGVDIPPSGGNEQNFADGHFLRIPLDPLNRTVNPPQLVLPPENDALTGRVVTFPPGNGPLSGLSFRVVRYIGAVPFGGDAAAFAQRYSITIDLTEADLSRSFSQVDNVTGETLTMPVGNWARWLPGVPNNAWTQGVYACYKNVGGDPNRQLGEGYSLYFNPVPINNHGVGVLNDSSSEMHYLTTDTNSPLWGTPINEMAIALQPRMQDLASTGSLFIRGQFGMVPTTEILGDSDEPHDAPDYNNMFLSHRFTGAATSADIIPSFHRAALFNYIVNWKNPNQYTEAEFLATLTRLRLATGRTLSLNVRTPSTTVIENTNFTGGNPATQLNLTVANWNGDWPTQVQAFRAWLDVMTLGRWDVDNDGDGVNDSVWVDIGLPPQTSPDGKLLKMLVAYYVDDLDKRLDVNATGSVPQANVTGAGFMYFDRPTNWPPTNPPPPAKFAVGLNRYLSQGIGYGPADISMRHLLGKPNLSWNGAAGEDQAELAYRRLMTARYSRNPFVNELTPGGFEDDPLSILTMRERNRVFSHLTLPGLPIAINGRASYALDRLGNISLWNIDNVTDEGTNDPYEARLIAAAHQDSPFTLSEWERIYRVSDSDRRNLPARLQNVFGETETSLTQSSLRHEITPISRHLRLPKLAGRGLTDIDAPNSFLTLINTILALKTDDFNAPTPTGTSAMAPGMAPGAFVQLFPLEFSRGLPMNLNRAFGNGVDNDGPDLNNDGIPDGDGEIDEPQELTARQAAYYVNQANPAVPVQPTADFEDYFAGRAASAMNVDPLWVQDYGNNLSGLETRQLYARHMYCLAQLLIPKDYVFPNVDRAYYQQLLQDMQDSRLTQAQRSAAMLKVRQIRGRTLAQWAINVVDYRDSDAAMSRFPYDEDPFTSITTDGFGNQFETANYAWDPTDDGGLNNGGHVVWGLEQPELLLTESLATHDIRVKHNSVADRFDQYRTPQGSLFLELYCPRTTSTVTSQVDPGVPSSLYRAVGGDVLLDVSRLAPGGFPVWRVYVTGPIDKDRSSGPALKTPHERLIAPPATNAEDPARIDLTYQLAASNVSDVNESGTFTSVADVRTRSGLEFDFFRLTDPDEALALSEPEPDPRDSQASIERDARVIVFADGFTPTLQNSPGVLNPVEQVYVNQTGDEIRLHGNQYMVIGPREITYFGSRTASASPPMNLPNRHRIDLTEVGTWVNAYTADGTLSRDSTAAGFPFRSVVKMVAGAALPEAWENAARSEYRNLDYQLKGFVGINVSEPAPGPPTTTTPPHRRYYRVPGDRDNVGVVDPLTGVINLMDTTGDPTETGAPGFGEGEADAYNDYVVNPNPSSLPPFDNGANGPLQSWDLNEDGNADIVATAGVVQPGTILDWSTAYLQRLADPSKPWDEAYNPYITVDWIPIDLTVFSGEENNSALDPPSDPDAGGVRFASRQKVGQTMDATSLEFDESGDVGQTFLSYLTSTPDGSNASLSTENYFGFELNLDEGPGTPDMPSETIRPADADGTDNFATFGFLNSHFVLAAEGTLTVPSFLASHVGSPGDPAQLRTDWHPDMLFWANRQFINPMEMAYVPLSSPGQLMQEFSGTASAGSVSVYQPSFRVPVTNNGPLDPRMPTAPVPRQIPETDQGDGYALPANGWPPPGSRWPAPANRPVNQSIAVENPAAAFPFSHLLNFFQEVPELPHPYRQLSVTEKYNLVHPKNTPVALLMELTETPSPWIDATSIERPSHFAARNTGNYSTALQAVITANNQVFATHRAPYNAISKYVEPGRVNLNTVAERNVFQGIWSNLLEPSDVDFPPYNSPTAGPEDIDHNGNGIIDIGERKSPGISARANAAWDRFTISRRGYRPDSGAYNPGGSVTRFNPNFPTEFAGLFKPMGEAGMVPITRNPIPAGDTNLHRLAERGVLDIYQRLNPVHSTLMRAETGAPLTAGILQMDETSSMFSMRNPQLQFMSQMDAQQIPQQSFTNFYLMNRLANLTTDRSNTFAVYVTLAAFEYDPATGIGIEYGSDRGEAKRSKAFYVIDRSIPVGYRVGQDENAGNTILVRRILTE